MCPQEVLQFGFGFHGDSEGPRCLRKGVLLACSVHAALPGAPVRPGTGGRRVRPPSGLGACPGMPLEGQRQGSRAGASRPGSRVPGPTCSHTVAGGRTGCRRPRSLALQKPAFCPVGAGITLSPQEAARGHTEWPFSKVTLTVALGPSKNAGTVFAESCVTRQPPHLCPPPPSPRRPLRLAQPFQPVVPGVPAVLASSFPGAERSPLLFCRDAEPLAFSSSPELFRCDISWTRNV